MPAEDVEHAIGNAAYRSTPYGEEPPYKIFCLGPDRAGNLLEVVLIELDGGDDLAIHAMKMRDKYVPLIGG